jgi:hypothetical protein
MQLKRIFIYTPEFEENLIFPISLIREQKEKSNLHNQMEFCKKRSQEFPCTISSQHLGIFQVFDGMK